MYNYIRYFDEKILYYIQKKLRCKALNFIFPKISAIGNGGFIWIAVAVILMLNKAYRKTGLIIVFGLMAGGYIWKSVIKAFGSTSEAMLER